MEEQGHSTYTKSNYSGFRKKETPKARNKMLSEINYKDIDVLVHYMSITGKIVSRSVSSVSARDQRKLARAIKRARAVALLPFTKR